MLAVMSDAPLTSPAGRATGPAAGGAAEPGTAPGTRRSRRRRIAARTRLDFWFDLSLLLGFTIAYSYGFTGIAIHEWLGIAIGVALLFHLTLHWDWVIRTTRRILSPRGHDKVIWIVNLALMFAMVFCVFSGILASRVALPQMHIFLNEGPFWLRLHILTAKFTLVLVPVHLALRWRWLVRVGRRLLTRRTGTARRTGAARRSA
jgi:hypothetical protein